MDIWIHPSLIFNVLVKYCTRVLKGLLGTNKQQRKKFYGVDFSVLLRFPILVKYFSGVPLDRRCLDLYTITTPGKKGLLGTDTLAHFASSSVFKK
jgi:hypothetical protein